jgi:RimJ/RimL family protein N-acetyltransferase
MPTVVPPAGALAEDVIFMREISAAGTIRAMAGVETTRLRLVPFEPTHASALQRGRSELAGLLRADIPDDWPEFPEAYRPQNPSSSQTARPSTESIWWGAYLFILKEEAVLVGSGGFKGKPRKASVEIGYEVAPAFRNRGFATEAAKGLIALAFSEPRVHLVRAHTLPERNASTRVLEKCGMSLAGVLDDPDDGPIWHWVLPRPDNRP